MFVNPKTKKHWQVGETYKHPLLANTLRRIAKNGYRELTDGESARNIVKELANMGGIITEEDFRDYRLN